MHGATWSLRPPRSAVLAEEPVIVRRAALRSRNLKLQGRKAPGQILRDEQARQRLADDLLCVIPQEARRALVPACDATLGVHEEDGEILDALHEQPPSLLGLASAFEGATQACRSDAIRPRGAIA